LLQSQLFGVTGTDSLTYLVSALLLLLLLAVALGACLASAWRGAGVNPTKALRTE
jgi:ABC-type lipoprotein release transport system permease subunit